MSVFRSTSLVLLVSVASTAFGQGGESSNLPKLSGNPGATFADCNSNGIDDFQDIADQTASDCNNDGFPDVCQIRTRLLGATFPYGLELDVATGAATPFSVNGFVGFARVSSLAYDANTNTLYGIDISTKTLITIDAVTGQGFAVGPIAFDFATGLAFDPNAKTLYGVDPSTDQLIVIDPTNGHGSTIATISLGPVPGLAFDSNTNTLFAVDNLNHQLVTIDPATGTSAVVGQLPSSGTVRGLAFDTNSKLLYATRRTSTWDDLVVIDPVTAAATNVGSLRRRVSGLAFDPNSNTLYGTDTDSDQLVAIDPVTAQTTGIGGLRFFRVNGLAFDPNTNTLYGTDSTVNQLITLDPRTGLGVSIGSFGIHFVGGLAFDSNANRLFGLRWSGVQPDLLVELNIETGAATPIGELGFETVVGLTFDANTDTLYGWDARLYRLMTIDRLTGAGTLIGETTNRWIIGLAFDPNTNTMYGVDDRKRILKIDTTTGAATQLIDLGFDRISDLAFDSSTNTLYGASFDSNQLLAIDPSTGATSTTGGIGFDIGGLAFDPNTLTVFGSDVSVGRLIAVNLVTGVGTTVGEPGTLFVEGLAFDPNTNTLYGSERDPGRLLTIDPMDGTVEVVGAIQNESGPFNFVNGLAFDRYRDILYAASGIFLITIDPSTAEATLVGFMDHDPRGLTFDPTTDMLYGTDYETHELVEINPWTAASTAIGPTGFSKNPGLTFIFVDCDANGVLDVCDPDNDGNGVADACDCAFAIKPQTPVFPSLGNPVIVKNRVLSVTPDSAGLRSALRVVLEDLPVPHDVFSGNALWVAEPTEFCEGSGQSAPVGGKCGPAPGAENATFFSALLQCDPFYADWSAFGTIQVRHTLIVPGGTYRVQAVNESCDASLPANFSTPLDLTTSRWGDILGAYSVVGWKPPDGSVDITIDVTGLLDKFKNLAGAPSKVRCDLEPSELDFVINFSDVTFCLDAFKGEGFPFVPAQWPCGE